MKRTITKIAIALALLMTTSAVAGPTGGSTKAIGLATAPITIDLYSDFQCPHCKELHDAVLPMLIADYVNTGKVYLVRHYFTLRFPYSKTSAVFACAAERIGRYNEACDALFKAQPQWSNSGRVEETVCGALSPADAQKVRMLAKDPSVAGEVEKDTELGMSQGVKATPTMFITHNGRHDTIDIVVTYSILKRYLDGLLAH